MDYRLLKHAQDYIEKMANGINPLTNEFVKEEDLINNVRISRCLFYVNTTLKELLSKEKKPKIKPFYLTSEELKKYEYNKYPLSITKILKKINNLITDQEMSKLKVSELVNWLLEENIIRVVEINGKVAKVPTEIGFSLGLRVEHVVALSKEYDKIMYNAEAEKYIITNFNRLLTFIKTKKLSQ